jgi:hypothetical protein
MDGRSFNRAALLSCREIRFRIEEAIMKPIPSVYAWTLTAAYLIALPVSLASAEDEFATHGGPSVPAESCIYYKHIDFGGESRSIPLGIGRKYVGDAWNDEISSIACASRCRLQVWEHRDYVGESRSFANGYATQYVGDAWNDRISSMKVFCDMPSRNSSNCSHGPDTCEQGFVWREASADDRICVAPHIRDQTRRENALAGTRRAGGGAYGPDTCLSGYVWREAFPVDTVCVPPESRERARRDNALASDRIACTP